MYSPNSSPTHYPSHNDTHQPIAHFLPIWISLSNLDSLSYDLLLPISLTNMILGHMEMSRFLRGISVVERVLSVLIRGLCGVDQCTGVVCREWGCSLFLGLLLNRCERFQNGFGCRQSLPILF
jgi:hypothetical protein